MKAILSWAAAVLGLVALAGSAWSSASASPQVLGSICKCCPHVYVFSDPDCDCTIQLQNEVRRFGRCALGSCASGGSCGTPTQTCKLTATAVEVGPGCTGSYDINITSPCGGDPEQSSVFVPCTSGGGSDHIIQLDCDPCTCPAVYNCP